LRELTIGLVLFQEFVETSVKENQTLQQLYSCGILLWLGYPWVFDVT